MLFAAEVLGDPDLIDAESACGLPVSAQVERLRRALSTRASDDEVAVLSVDLYSLVGADRDAALDAVVSGKPSPFVLYDGRLICAGAVDLPVVLAALG